MAIRGSLREASLPDVLQLLALGQKTGCLAVADRTRFGYVWFDRGSISYASIVNRRDRLGDLLVRNGLVTPDELAEAVDAQAARGGTRLGELLIERGAINRGQLERYIHLQIEEAVYYLFTWTEGTFSFSPDERPEEGSMLVSINPESVLLEGARRVDEWSLIEKKIPTLDLVVGLTRDPRAVVREEVTPEQRRVVAFMDGQRTVREIVDEAGLVEFDVGKAIFGLMQAGLAQPLGRRAPAPGAERGPDRAEDHRNLGVAFYRTGMLTDAAREFERALQLDAADAVSRFHLALVQLRTGRPRRALRTLQAAIEGGAAWGAAFHGMALALETLGMTDDALVAIDEARERLADHPTLLLSRAVLLCKAGRPREAKEGFVAYRSRLPGGERPPAVYYAFAMLAAGALGRIAEARALAEEGVGHYPHVAPVLLHAGAVHERIGVWEEAELLYRRAAEEAPLSARVHRALADALQRRGADPQAADAYERAIALAPDRAGEPLYRLGNLRYREGRREEAVALWRRALEREPGHSGARTSLELVERALAGGPRADG